MKTALDPQKRSLKLETLEGREMMAADIGLAADGILEIQGTIDHDDIDIACIRSWDTNTGRNGFGNFNFSSQGSPFKIQATIAKQDGEIRIQKQFNLFDVQYIKVIGGMGNDHITNNTSIQSDLDGGIGNDRLEGGTNIDYLKGGSGDDTIIGNAGNDYLWGSFGNDRLYGKEGNDFHYGDDGDDYLSGASGNDIFYGGSGNDTIKGWSGNDRLYGGDGDDLLYGKSGADKLYGNNGDDYLSGASGNDKLYGNDGDDIIRGWSGHDHIYGGSGDDVLHGHSGNDKIYGNNGADRLYANTGLDKLYGGNGNDILVSMDNRSGDQMSGNRGNDVFWGDSTDRLTGINSYENKHSRHLINSFDNGADKTLNGDRITPGGGLFSNNERFMDFRSHSLFSEDGPQRSDIGQGATGDCWLMAGLGTIAHTNPERIVESVVDFGDGTYGVNLADQYFRVDARLAVNSDGDPIYAGLGDDDSLWAAITEKAWSEYRGDIPWGMNAGYTTRVWEAFGGRNINSEYSFWSDHHDTFNHIRSELNAGKVVTVLTDWVGHLRNDQLVNCHYYMVDSVNVSAKTISLVNPWGDGGLPGERIITVTASDLHHDMSNAATFGGVQSAKM